MAFYPLVGVILGALIAVLASLMGSFLPQPLTVLLMLMFWVILTGGLHLDGLADTLDGFIGGKNKESTLSIMRDPTVGTMGILAIFFVLAVKWQTLLSFPPERIPVLLIFVVAIGRYLMVLGAFVSRYPHQEGAGKNYIGKISLSIFLTASLFMLLIAVATFQIKGLFLFLAALVGSVLWIVYCRRRIGGMTGDNLGALGEVSEAVLLLLLTVNPV